MLNIFKRIFRTKLAANETASTDSAPSAAFANEFKEGADGDTLVQLSPFGKFPNVQGLQLFNPADAKRITGDLVANAKMKFGKGLPWFIGHPDHPLHEARYKDGRAYGRIKSMEAKSDDGCAACNTFMANDYSRNSGVPWCREHGLFARVRFNEDGKKLIANESYDSHSINWPLKKNGAGWHPYSLKSVGFTNEGNMPSDPISLANEPIEDELLKRRFSKLTVIRAMVNIVTHPPIVPRGTTHYRAMANLRKK